MDMFAAYLPMDRRQALVEGRQLPDRTSGTALFADISGFTALTEVFSRELGSLRGAEEITHQLNSVYGALIREVHRYGGSVIGFSGDAITCWFDGDNGRFATACALKMQNVMGLFESIITPTNRVISLAIKIAVVAGQARRFLVGDSTIQNIEALAGSLLDRMATAESLVAKSEVIVGNEIIALFGEDAVVTEWRTASDGRRFAVISDLMQAVPTHPWPDVPDLDPTITRKWLLPPIYRRLNRRQGEFLAELRPAVALFFRFQGIDYDADDDAGEKLNQFILWVQTILSRYEGHLLQLTIGDKGSYVYAAFGAPLAHENDAERAVATVLALQNLPDHLHFIGDMQIGISQGQMRTGAYGSSTRRTYGVMGRVVNLAARLMNEATPGQILVTARIVETTASTFTFTPFDMLTLKGVTEPVSVFTVQPQDQRSVNTAVQPSATASIGRNDEQRLLAGMLQTLTEQEKNQCLILEGEAGIGKSRLVADLVQMATSENIRTLTGAGDAIEQSTPYFVWRSVFQEILLRNGFAEGDDRRQIWLERIASTLQAIDPELLRLSPLLDAVVPVEMNDNAFTSQMSGEVRADNTQDLLVKILKHVVKNGPLLLILEDAHWLDSASWSLTRLVCQEMASVFVVICVRPFTDHTPSEFEQIRQAPSTQHLHLTTLEPAAIETLICRRMDINQLPEPVARLIHEKAEGHPFFSEELAYALRDADLLQIVDGEGRLAADAGDLSSINFPNTIQGVILSRLDRLPPQPQLTLKVASIIGRIFAYRLLRDIYPVQDDKSGLSNFLQMLDQLELTLLETPEPDLSYIFKHVITQEVAYSLMTFAQRKQLHRVTAKWYEKTYADDLSGFYPLLAHHWQQAVDDQLTDQEAVSKAIDYLEKAGDQAFLNFANREAIRFFGDAIRLDEKNAHFHPHVYPRHPRKVSPAQFRRARWYRRLAASKVSLGMLPEAVPDLEEAACLLGRPLPYTRFEWVSQLFKQLARQLWHRLHPPELSLAPGLLTDVLQELVHVFELRGTIYAISNEFPKALMILLASTNQAEKVGPLAELGLAYANMGNVSGVIPLHKLALNYVQMAEETAVFVNQLPTTAVVNSRISIHLASIGQWQRAENAVKQSLAVAEELDDRRQWGETTSVYAAIIYYQGRFAEFFDLSTALAQNAHQRGDALFEAWGLNGQARGHLRQGEFVQAAALAEQVLALIMEADLEDPGTHISTLSTLSLALTELEQETRAIQPANQALALLRRHPDPVTGRVISATLTAEAFLALMTNGADNQLPALTADAREACKLIFKRVRAYPVGLAPAHLYRGLFHWLSQKPNAAYKDWSRSVSFGEKYKMFYEAGMAHYFQARYLSPDQPDYGEKRPYHISRATEFFQQLNLSYQLSLVQGLESG